MRVLVPAVLSVAHPVCRSFVQEKSWVSYLRWHKMRCSEKSEPDPAVSSQDFRSKERQLPTSDLRNLGYPTRARTLELQSPKPEGQEPQTAQLRQPHLLFTYSNSSEAGLCHMRYFFVGLAGFL